MCSTLEKASLSLGLFVSQSSFVCLHRNYSGSLALKMTGVDNTHLTQAAIPFQVAVNNSLIFLLLQTNKNNCQVSVSVETIIPCFD